MRQSATVGRRARVVVVEPAHGVGFEEVAGRVVDHRRRLELVVGHGVHEQLVHGHRHRRHRARRARPTAARLPPALSPPIGDAGGVTAEIGRVRGDPRPRGDAVVDRARELRLGREPVVDRHHDRVDRIAEQAAREVVRLERAGDPTAAVQPDDDRQRRRPTAGTPARGSPPPGREPCGSRRRVPA